MGSMVRPEKGRRKLSFHLRVIQEERNGPEVHIVTPRKEMLTFLEEVA